MARPARPASLLMLEPNALWSSYAYPPNPPKPERRVCVGDALATSGVPLQDHEVSYAQFRALANSMPTLAWMAHPDGWIFWYNQRWYSYTGTTAEGMAGWGWQSVHDPEVLPTVLERWTSAITHGKAFEMVFPLRGADNVFRPFLTRVEPLYEDGELVGWFGTNTEISEQERNRERLQLMINELNHRVKNTLATIQSIGAHTFASAPPELRRSFDDRLVALAATHDILTKESWTRASLRQVVTTALAHCDEGRVEVCGDDVSIAPRVAPGLSMTIHELCTNAVKYGALSRPGGKVQVSWNTVQARGAPLMLVLDWREVDGPPVVEPAHKGFGHKLITRVMAAERGASVEHRFEPAGVTCRITFPLGTDVLQ